MDTETNTEINGETTADIAYLLKIEGETLLVQGNLTIGRHIDNDIIVAGEDVLDFHLRLELCERGPNVIPLGNATFALNGNEVEGIWSLIPGDVLGIGVVAVHVGIEREQADGIRAWVLAEQDTERIHDIADDFLIGRHPECGLQLDSEHVSRRHARIVQVAGGVWIQDLGSANGTQLNGRTIRGGCRLLHGDEVRFDELAFRVRGIGEDLTVMRPFRDEDLRPIRVLDGSTSNETSEGGRSLVANIESSIKKRGVSQQRNNTATSVSSVARLQAAPNVSTQRRATPAQDQHVLEGLSDSGKVNTFR